MSRPPLRSTPEPLQPTPQPPTSPPPTHLLPTSLLRMKRGLCPHCGLPLPLDEDGPTTRCAACGCQAILERRLRTTEPELPGAPLRAEWGHEEDPHHPRPAGCGPWVRSAQFRQGDLQDRRAPDCPGCGVGLEVGAEPESIDILRCPACGTDARFERRLVAVRGDGAPPAPRARGADESPNLDDLADDDPESEHLVWRIVGERDVDRRVGLALNLLRWRFVNRTVARFAHALVSAMHAGPRDERFEQAVADGLGCMLNHGDVVMRDAVLVAAEPWMFRPGTSRALISALGLGSPVGVKLLLDSAEWAVRRGDDDHAAACLNAVNWLFQRNFEAHGRMGEVLMYRLLYLSGPVLAFALGVAQRKITGTGFHFPPPALLRFMDDAEAERPSLLPELERAYYGGRPGDAAELAGRLELHRSLRGPGTRAASMRHHLGPPQCGDEASCAALVGVACEVLDDPRAGDSLHAAAEALLCDIIVGSPTVPAAMHELVAARGDALPAEVRRRYLAEVRTSPHLDPSKLPYWESPAPTKESAEVAAALARWTAALDAVVERDEARRQALRDHWSARASSPEAAALDVR